ncbi:hypothetical protein MKW94_002398 [Papaver nudicaule]|uniref:DC1 domain-containing protein n=1 Tax=Papaver nudicaule TaxID=74823 RepID=A0AA41S238_PAPNU|nr:hypothetical protein [Papaver nudicaule]
MAPRNPAKTSSPAGETVRHFTHPHVLSKEALDPEVYTSNRFGCDGCGMDGTGVRYHCKQCGFDLHEDCATCPEYFTSFIHPNHQLERTWEGPESYGQWRPCNVCGDEVKGLFYKCSSGAAEKSYDDEGHYFFLHPSCARLPAQLLLKIQSVPVIPDAWCAICKNLVSSDSWSYRCDSYGLVIHPQCVTLPNDNVQQSSGSGSTRSSAQSQVAQAEADADALAAAMYAAKMSAKTNKFILKNLI